MKNIFTLIFIAISLTILARLGYPQQSQQSSAQTITLTATTPPTIQNVSANRSGAPGNSVYYYTVIANYPRGQSNFSRQAIINNAPDTLTASNFITINWSPVNAPLPSSSITYDVLRTLTPSIPVPCTCAVATGLTSPTFINNSTTINSYTLSPVPNVTAHITLDNISRSNARIVIDTPSNNPIIGTNTIGAGANVLPTTGVQTGSLTVVSDGASTSDCTTGAGTSFALCMWNGSAWTSIGGGGGFSVAGSGLISVGNTISLDTTIALTRVSQQSIGPNLCTDSSGTTNYVCVMNPVISSCTTNMSVYLLASVVSVTTATLDVGCGPKSIKRSNGSTDPGADIPTTGIWLRYNGTVWTEPLSLGAAGGFPVNLSFGHCTNNAAVDSGVWNSTGLSLYHVAIAGIADKCGIATGGAGSPSIFGQFSWPVGGSATPDLYVTLISGTGNIRLQTSIGCKTNGDSFNTAPTFNNLATQAQTLATTSGILAEFHIATITIGYTPHAGDDCYVQLKQDDTVGGDAGAIDYYASYLQF